MIGINYDGHEVKCNRCMKEITICPVCSKKFKNNDDVLCLDVGGAYIHFCSEECKEEYLDTNLVRGKAIKVMEI